MFQWRNAVSISKPVPHSSVESFTIFRLIKSLWATHSTVHYFKHWFIFCTLCFLIRARRINTVARLLIQDSGLDVAISNAGQSCACASSSKMLIVMAGGLSLHVGMVMT